MYNYEVGINFDTQVDDGSLKRSYLSKYGSKKFKNKSWKKKGINPDEIEKEEIENEESKENKDEKKKRWKKKSEVFIGNSEENIIREKRDKKEKIKWYKNLPNVDLIKQFNHFYRSSIKLEDKEINLFDKALLTEGVLRLSEIKFKNVEKLWLLYISFRWPTRFDFFR